MTQENHPLLFFPTRVTVIEDDPLFLETLKLLLDTNQLKHDAYMNPGTFIDNIETKESNSFLSLSQYNSVSQLPNIYKLKNRDTQNLVVITDFNMPDMNGSTLGKKLKAINHHIKVIMLTGEADINIAVDAFNQGCIDHFINKNATDLPTTLPNIIHQLQIKYFNECAEHLSQNQHPLTLTESYQLTLNETLKKLDIAEHYTFDALGSKLLISTTGKRHYLIIKDDRALNNLIELAEFADTDQLTLKKLKNKENIPALLSDSAQNLSPDNWNKIMIKLHKKPGFYYAIASENEAEISNCDHIDFTPETI